MHSYHERQNTALVRHKFKSRLRFGWFGYPLYSNIWVDSIDIYHCYIEESNYRADHFWYYTWDDAWLLPWWLSHFSKIWRENLPLHAILPLRHFTHVCCICCFHTCQSNNECRHQLHCPFLFCCRVYHFAILLEKTASIWV